MKPVSCFGWLALGLPLGSAFMTSYSCFGGFNRIHQNPPCGNQFPSTQPPNQRAFSPSALNEFRVPFLVQQHRTLSKASLRDTFRPLIQKMRRWAKRSFLTAAFFFAIYLTSATPASARSGVRSGGRMGGSFGAPTRAPMMRSIPRAYRSRSQPRMIIHRGPHIHVHSPSTTYSMGGTPVMPQVYGATVRRVSMSDLVFVTGVGAVITLNVIDKLQDGSGTRGLDTPLGRGVSVLSLTAAVNVPDRDSPNSILARLSRLAVGARTDTRKGVQDLITETASELLRQKDYIVSVDSMYSHFSRVVDAQREFNSLSIGGRSKFDEETASNFGGDRSFETGLYASIDAYPRATVAVVTINICIEGDSTRVNKIRNRIELRSALSRIASDCQVDDCLLSGEVLWSPESRTERITSEDIYADYPSLFPLLE